MELLFLLLFASLRKLKQEKLKKYAEKAATTAKTSLPVTLK
jgi:hypothetical protein